jgi:hypothetical protein
LIKLRNSTMRKCHPLHIILLVFIYWIFFVGKTFFCRSCLILSPTMYVCELCILIKLCNREPV